MGWTVKLTVLLFLINSSFPVTGTAFGHAPGSPDVSELFASDSVLELELYMDIDSLCADIGENPSYHEALMVYRVPGEQRRVELSVEVRTRGSFRKKPENCDFPPLKLKFDKTSRRGSIFEDLKDIKVVTHCQSDLDDFEQYVLQEYLIYKAYNLFTEFSLRVRLARITYVDLSSGRDSFTRYAFLLEDPEDMAERNKAHLLELGSIQQEKLDQKHFALMALFNYMILNTDYSVPIMHNIELVYTDNFKPPLPVPYDFDWSGLINIPYDSPYATRNTRYPGRIYKGPCLKRKQLEVVFSKMYSRHEDLDRLYRNFPYLDEDMRNRTLQELDMFYITIGSRKLVRQEFIRNCVE